MNEKEFYEKRKNWSFDEFNIRSESLTNLDIYDVLKSIANKNSKILDLGTGGGEKLLKNFPEVKEILGTDYSKEMIKTANENLLKSKRKNIHFKVMDNFNMNVENNYFDIVVARNTPTDAKQIYNALKKGGYLIIHGVDKYDCYELKLIFKKEFAYTNKKPISISDYENVYNSGFNEIELIPIHKREFFKNKKDFYNFLLKVPIIDDFDNDYKCCQNGIDKNLLEYYIKRNTFNNEIRLVRRYYAIIAKK